MAGAVPQDRFVFSRRVRFAASAYVAASVRAGLARGATVRGQQDYFRAWATVCAFPLVPALLVTPHALRNVAQRERVMWRLWTGGWAIVYSGGLLVYLIGTRDWTWLKAATLPAAALG